MNTRTWILDYLVLTLVTVISAGGGGKEQYVLKKKKNFKKFKNKKELLTKTNQ
jgi:hypothetical protein